MARRPAKLRFFTDHNIPDSVGDYLRGRGHSVHRLRHHIPEDSPDPIVATVAIEADRILVTQDKDFSTQRFMQPRFARLSRLSLSCDALIMVERLKAEIETIELRWARAKRINAARMIVHLGRDQIRFRD